MGLLTVVLAVLAISFVVYDAEAGGSCPLPSKVYSCSPKCVEKYECTGGKECCPNSCNSKSCVEPASYGGNTGDKYNKQGGGAGVYCNNVKCNSYEVCKMDPSTKRMKCMRA